MLTRTLYGEEAAKRPDLLPEREKEQIRSLSSAVAAVVGGVAGGNSDNHTAGVLADAQTGGVVGRNAVENNWLSAKQLIEFDKAHAACGSDEVCKQRVIDVAKTLSQSQDTRLTWAKISCTAWGSCDELNAMNRQWAHSLGIHNVVAELRKHYPHASHQDLLAAARRYSAEAADSFDKGSTRFIVGVLNDLPALGAVGSGVRSGARGLVNSTLKRSAINAAPSREAAEHLARHPLLDDALERAGTLSRPTIYQGNLPTCGHNCATLILNQHGKAVDVGSLIQSIPPSNRGIHGYDVATLLKQNGLDALSVTRRNVDDLARYTARGESVIVRIQKNDFSHFVVVDGVTMRNGKRVVAVRDPHGIQYFSPVDTFRQSFTGDVIITR